MSVLENILAGDVLAVSRFIRDVDDDRPGSRKILRELFKYSGNGIILGVTGFSGSGKSTLISSIISHYRKEGRRVGVIAVDPTSPFSGGAILGDRIRMSEHNEDPGVYIKSVATRGTTGGLSKSVVDIVHVLEAAKNDVIIIETVGVGQDEIDIAKIAGQVLVVMAPGLGDDIQAIKAGIIEIADVFVINKCDLHGSQKAADELKEAGLGKPIVLTDAVRGVGVDELIKCVNEGLAKFGDKKIKSENLRRRFRFEIELRVRDRLMEIVKDSFEKRPSLQKILRDVGGRKIDPYTATERVMEEFKIK